MVRGRVDSSSSSFLSSLLPAARFFSAASSADGLVEGNCLCQNARGEVEPGKAMATLTDLLGLAVRNRHCYMIKPPAGGVLGLVSCTASPCIFWTSALVSIAQASGWACLTESCVAFCLADITPASGRKHSMSLNRFFIAYLKRNNFSC